MSGAKDDDRPASPGPAGEPRPPRRSRGLAVQAPCPEDWATFVGDDRSRHCERCSTAVHDLSTMTRAEATELFRRSRPGSLCVRFAEDGQGRTLFRSEGDRARLVWMRFVPPRCEGE
ncbi:MAG: hypothetical protein R3B09_34035 [Nannocystaceae bacterium]